MAAGGREQKKKKKNCTPKEEPEIHPGPRLWKVSYSQGTAESPGRPHSPGTMPHANPRLRSRQSSVHLPPTCYDEDSKCQVTSHSVLLLGETSSLRGRYKGNPKAGGGQILRKPSGNNSNALIKQTVVRCTTGFPGGASGNELTSQCRRQKRQGFDPWSGRCPGGRHGNWLQYSCLEIPMVRELGGLQSMGSQSQTWPKQLSTRAHGTTGY